MEQISKLRQLCTQKLASLPYGEHVLVELAALAQNIGEGRAAQAAPHINDLQLSLVQTPHELIHQVALESPEKTCNQLLGPVERKTLEAEQELLATAAAMRKLRKSLTPPPIPPPPVPTKSSDTALKAQQTRTIALVEDDVSARNVNAKEQKTTFSANGEAGKYDDDNKLMNDTNECKTNPNTNTNTNTNTKEDKTSSLENNSRQAKQLSTLAEQNFSSSSTEQTHQTQQTQKTHQTQLNTQYSSSKSAGMQSVESELGRMFPRMGDADIFAGAQKRFSNIESSTGGTSSARPKRYSNIETHSYESEKRIENGNVVYDYADSKHEMQTDGDSVDGVTTHPAKTHVISIDKSQVASDPVAAQNIMSATKLNQPATMNTNGEKIARDQGEIKNSSANNMSKTYEEFRHRAKAEALKTPLTTHFDQEKLFKDFDELSQQLHRELETGREQREKREKSASLFDLSNSQMKQQFEQLKRQRHDHMLELEREIERSMRSRQSARREMSCDAPTPSKTHEIPIRLENGTAHQIPISVENGYHAEAAEAMRFEHDHNSPFRRTESMFNLSQNPAPPTTDIYARPRTSSSNYESQHVVTDDWSQYASDLGSSENITRPFAREMQICYQRERQPRTIRAPRLTVSTNDLTSPYAPPTYDTNNAYNVRRSQAPMLQQVPQMPSQTQYSSCYSVLERNPNPTYISTTSRRGVSPAPQSVPVNVRPQSQRRASLPREIQEQQLKYITSKEEELRLEFERLQNERRRLMDELTQEVKAAEGPQVPPRPMRDNYRMATRLPTLSEDEVFRQQMAEEWLNKVAEREERRLQKIIKVSKIHEHGDEEEEHLHKPDISQEFLSRVKERRSKLHMPADSDWESGAESQPIPPGPASETEDGVKVLSGRSMANLQQLPRHLKEFARYSDQRTEQLEGGGQRTVYNEEEQRQEADAQSASTASKKSSIVKTVKISRLPPQTQAPRQGECTSIQDPASTCNAIASAKINHANDSPSFTQTTNANNTSKLTTSPPSSSQGTGSFLGTALVIGLGILGAWSRLA